MPGRLNLYRFVDDAWEGGLRDWCRAAAEFQAQGIRSWLVLENPGQQRWLPKSEGVEAVDARGLRLLLAQEDGIPPPLAHGATAALVVKVAAHRHPGLEATAVQRDPGALLEGGSAPAGLPRPLAKALDEALVRAAVTPAAFDARLRKQAARLPVRLCWLGWDAAHWLDFVLMETTAGRAVSSDFFVPLPRLPAEAVQRDWIEMLEKKFQLERVICPASGFPAANEALVSRLERSGLSAPEPAETPGLLVGRDWCDQVELVCAEAAAWIGRDTRPLGIVAPPGSVTAAAVGDKLVTRGLTVEEPGRVRELAGPLLIAEQIARYHLQGHDIEELIELGNLLFTHASERWSVLEPEAVHRVLDFAFRAVQSRNARVLARALPGRDEPVWGAVCEIVRALGRWESEGTWAVLRAQWEEAVRALHLPLTLLEPLWSRTESLFRDEAIPGHFFMEWLAAELGELRRDREAPDFAAKAPVVITTFAEAAQQSWGRIIFLDCNEHVWPLAFPENPFFADAAKKLRQVPTSRDRWALDQAHFLDLVEHCAGGIVFAGVTLAPTETREAQPNEWVLRALLETGEPPLETWTAAARTCPAEPAPPLPGAEHFAAVHASRHDPARPSDRYAFNLQGSKLKAQAWSATRLDLAVTCPATFALSELFGAESLVPGGFARNEGQAVGSRAHRWLVRVLGGREDLREVKPGAYEHQLQKEFTISCRELEEWYAGEGLPLPLWWETCLQKTAWATRRCFQELGPLFTGHYCAMEQRLEQAVETEAGPLLLKGRVDILLADQPRLDGAHVRIFDFKTGRQKPPNLGTLDRGEGHQFAAYYLMARAAGAASAGVGIIRPDEALREVFGDADEVALRARFGHLAELQQNLRFERRGPLISEYGRCETLPMATAPIDPKVLEQKAGFPAA